MEERRKFERVPMKLRALYHLQGEESWKECSVINLSRNGMGIAFLTQEKIDAGSTIHLKVFYFKDPHAANVEGILKWIKPMENDFIGGIEITLLTRASTPQGEA